ncbi:MAG: HD domain-containing protein [Candidatus Paceibacterota bacterium]|jgi:5'-deoxynucleotidase YfbR-like HD superfamily hydrolase
MKKITEIYEKYDIMPNLKDHMLRVGAVAYLICENIEPSLLNKEEKSDIIEVCLLHDMGNIVKSDFSLLPPIKDSSKNVEYWKKKKEEYIKKYGEDDHEATMKILKEIGRRDNIIHSSDKNRFSLVCDNLNDTDFKIKIIQYSDFRVGPFGVLSFEERMEEAKERYKNRPEFLGGDSREKLINCGLEIEKQIFLKCKIKPEDINDITVAPIIKELENFEISVE